MIVLFIVTVFISNHNKVWTQAPLNFQVPHLNTIALWYIVIISKQLNCLLFMICFCLCPTWFYESVITYNLPLFCLWVCMTELIVIKAALCNKKVIIHFIKAKVANWFCSNLWPIPVSVIKNKNQSSIWRQYATSVHFSFYISFCI